ncbi:MAG: YkgJ family cysteine cluster protein [Chlamydiae bacterium]|nr:YkgJ family cysteine cluster protein [Chlamydiota bacterium]
MSKDQKFPWYKDGLNFKCTQCGACCTGSPGYVWISDDEIIEMSQFLNLSVESFVRKFTRSIYGRRALLEHPKTYDCVFLENNTCTLYNTRPKQCRTYPWWPELVASKEAWLEESGRCEGINHPDADLVSLEEIQKQLSLN